MELKVFTVYDSKTEAYLQPFFMQSKGAAIRAFIDALRDPNHQFAKHAEDYTLFEVGSYDDGSARFTSLVTPVSLGTALDLKCSD